MSIPTWAEVGSVRFLGSLPDGLAKQYAWAAKREDHFVDSRLSGYKTAAKFPGYDPKKPDCHQAQFQGQPSQN